VIYRLLLAALVAALAACSSTDKPKPTPLEAFEPKIAARAVWNARLGKLNFPLLPAVRGSQVVVADNDGAVIALQADTGTEIWRASAGAALSAGVGSDGRFASVVTRGNEVVVFDNGRELWRKRLPASVVTPPLVAGERVFVMGVDRAVQAFDALDGRRLWTLQRPGDALTLSQASVVSAFANSLLVGQGARLTAVDPLKGSVLWEVPLAATRGTNEVERLADLVGPAVRLGDRVCARAFQSAVGCADAVRGALLWTRNVGGVNAVASDDERVFGADASDRITAWRAGNGDVAWTSEKLQHRILSGAAVAGPSVVFGDSEGYVHFLSALSGETLQRLPTDGTPVIGTPVIAGLTLLVTTRGGGLFAFRQN
jgi:outer membrane protein assembly factor BamB